MRSITGLILLGLASLASAVEPEIHWMSTGVNNRDLTISPEGDLMLTTIMWPGNHFSVIVMIEKRGDTWQSPEVAPFSGTWPDIEPMFSPDGEELFFASKRPAPDKAEPDWDIWVTQRAEEGWGAPVRLPAPVNTGANEFYPSVAGNGNLYFTAEREGGLGTEDIWRAISEDGRYTRIENVGETVNTSAYEFNAWIAPEEDYIIFSSQGRADEIGGGDLYISHRNDAGQFEPAVALPEGINSPALDYCPFVRGDRFYFTSRKAQQPGPLRSYDQVLSSLDAPGNGMGDIYSIALKAIMKGSP